ncbi:MAG: hypothetical protein Q8N17_26835, partial [Burkholderiaceae bacterium]|nr:hypothetical protein [Burkholderiaceae bacterium]
TVAQITAIDTANTTGALTYTALADTANNLAPSGVAVGAVKAGANVTVTGAATVAQIAAIDAANTIGTLTYTALSDSANNLAPSGVAVGAIKAATDVTVTSAATVAQIAAIDTANTTGALTYAALSDSAANLLPSGVASSAIKSGTNVTVTGTLSVAQHGLIDTANGSGTLTYTDLSDTAANLLPSGVAAAAITAGVNVTITSALSVSGLTLIDNANGGGTLSYSALTDTADNLAPSGTVIGAVKSGTTVTLTGTSASATQLNNLNTATTAAVGAASLTSITGTATEIATIASAIAAGTITHGGNWNSTPSGTATVAQINTINANNGSGTITATVSDTSAATLATLTGTHALTTTVAAGSAAAADLNAIDTATSVTVGATAVTTLTGTAANVKTAIASAGISLSGSYAVTVSDSTSVADANTIDAATTGVVTASITEGAVNTLKTLTGTNNAYTITVTDTTAAAADLKTLDTATTVNVGATAVTTITGTSSDIKTVAAASTITRAANWAATVSGSVLVADANTIEAANGSGVVTATISEGSVATLKTLTGTGNAYTLNVSDATAAAADLKALDALTTVNVGASSALTINGTAADVRDVAVAATIARAANWSTNVTGSLSVSDANAIDGANGTGVVTAGISDGALSTLKTLTGTNNAYTITVSDTTGAAADLKTVDAASTVTVAATAVTTLTGTAADIKDVAAAAGISKAANWAATVSGSVSVADANTINAANGSGVITATIAEGAVATLKTLTGTGNAYTLSLTDTSAEAADLKTLDGLTTVNVGAAAVTTITGSATDVKDVAAAAGITKSSNWAATLSGSVSVADANIIDAANGTGVITATIASGTAASLRTLTGTGNAYALTTTDASVAAADLIALDTRSTVSVSALTATTLTGSAGDVATAISATTINTAGNVAATVSGTATVAQMATIKANTTGSITYSLDDTAANIATAVAGNATLFSTATAISHTAVQVGAATGTTGVVDTFKFASAGTATISNFVDAQDKLDLTAFVNSTIAFQALAADANTVDIFVSDSGADRLLQVDTNNDGAADFSITLAGRAGTTIDSADFNQTGSPTAPTSVTITSVGGTAVTNAINGSNTNLSLSATIVAGEATGGKAEFYVGATKLGEDNTIASGDTSVSYTTSGASHDELHAVLAAGGVVSVKLITSDGHNATSSAGNPTLLVDYDAATAPTAVQVNAVGGTVVANTINSTNTHLTAQATIVAGEATGGSATLKVNGTTVATDASIGAGDTQVTFTTSDGTPSNAELLAAIAAGGTVTVTLTDAAGNAITSSVGNPTLTRDVTAPAASSSTPIAGSDMAGASGYGEGDVITLKFSEAVDTSKVTLGNLSLSAHSLGTSPTLTAIDASGGYASTFRIVLGASATVAATDTITLAASNAVDAAGNPAAAAVTFTVPAITAPVLARATTGTDTLVGTAANDVFVIVGVTAAGQYTGADANFADLTTLNSKSTSEANSGDSINGGAGYNVLHVYGTTDLSGVTLSNIQKVVMHSDVTFSEAQLGIAGLVGISGDGGSSMRIADSGAASVDLSALTLSNIGQLDLGDNVKAIASQTNLGALTTISSGVTDRLTPLPTGAGVTGVTTVTDLVAKMTAAPGYSSAPFTVSESGGNLVLTWKTNGNITGTSFLQKSASGTPIYATVTDGTAGTQEVHTIAPGTLTAGDVYRLSAGDSTSALQGSTGVSLNLAGKSVFGNMPVLEADSSVKYAALDTAGVGTPVNTVITSINALLVAIDTNSGSFITTALGGAAAKNTLVAPVVEGEYKLVFGFLDTTANVLKGREGFQNFIAGGSGSDYLYGASDKSNFITAGANETLNTPTNRLFGGGQRDFLSGGDGKDIIWGAGGSDFVASGKGDDTLYGEDGTDLLDGGEGNDLIVGGAGVDFLQSGTGNDKIAFTTTATQDYLLDFSGAGTALASFSASDELLIFDLTVFTGLTGVAGAASIDAPKALASNVVYVGTSAAFGALGAGTATYRLWLNTDGYAGGGASTLIYDADGNWQAGNVNVVSLLGVNTLGAGDIGVY